MALPDIATPLDVQAALDGLGAGLPNVPAPLDIQAAIDGLGGSIPAVPTPLEIQAAINALPSGSVDKSALAQALSKAANVDRYQWTAATVGPFDQAYSDGQTVYSDNGATQTDVDNATQTLNSAIGALVGVTFTAGSGTISVPSINSTYQIPTVYNGVGTVTYSSSNPVITVSATGLVRRANTGGNSAITIAATGLTKILRPAM